MEKQNSFVRFMLLFGIMLILTQLSMRWLGLVPEVPPEGDETQESATELVEGDAVVLGAEDDSYVAVGSYDPAKGEKYLAYFNSRGASLDRVELVERDEAGELKYGVIEFRHGYLGYLAPLVLEGDNTGLQVRVIGDGTPAQQAGLQVGDIITSFKTTEIQTLDDWDKALGLTVPGEDVTIEVVRAGTPQSLSVTLGERPLAVIDPAPYPPVDSDRGPLDAPNSLLTKLTSVNQEIAKDGESPNLPSLAGSNWELIGTDGRSVTFQMVIDNVDQQAAEGEAGEDVGEQVGPFNGAIAVSKTFTLAPNAETQAYHVNLEIEFANQSEQLQRIAFRQYGPNSIVNESWWTSVGKTRDVKWSMNGEEDDVRAATILEYAQENPDSLSSSIWQVDETVPTLDYLVTDSQFFAAGFVGDGENPGVGLDVSDVHTVLAEPIDGVTKKSARVPNTSFFVDSAVIELKAMDSVKQNLRVFIGPKGDELLASYGMKNVIEYGWFRTIARTLGAVMHGFQSLVGNYGVAIIMLTILVRGCMHPLSRKQVRSTQLISFLKPQMEKINEKFKDDARQKSMKQQELFAKYGYNLFGGCMPIFIQMPIFFGLYRSIMVDVELRGQALIPGIDWCANLAGPDMLYYFGESTSMLINRGGFVGPYLNLLPILTIVLFLLQQKIYTPPATDDTQKMAQRMMKFMFLFMGFMFFRVASGLCIYFVASSTWGILERKMLPKIKDPDAYLESLAEARRSKKRKPGFMQRMMEAAEAQQGQSRGKPANSDSERRKQLDSLRSGRRRR